MICFDGLDKAIVGRCERNGETFLVYDFERIILILMDRDGMGRDEAIDFFYFNIDGMRLGPEGPGFLRHMESDGGFTDS